MIERVAGERALPTELLQQIVTKTDGVPLFVEELTKMVVESVGATSRSRPYDWKFLPHSKTRSWPG